ncbi:MAG: hypothetical protein ABIK07_17600 [Planctomycetota bacterium]
MLIHFSFTLRVIRGGGITTAICHNISDIFARVLDTHSPPCLDTLGHAARRT